MPFCSSCGSAYEFGINHCPKCGHELPKLNSILENNKSKELPKGEEKDLTAIPVAQAAKRISAGVVDIIIGIGLLLFVIRIILFRLILRRAFIRGFFTSLVIYAIFAAAYFLFRDSLKGKSIGKLLFGLTVINVERKRPADIADSLLRNAIFAFIVVPFAGWIIFILLSGLISLQIFMGKEQRIGDKFAHTKVIEDRYLENVLA